MNGKVVVRIVVIVVVIVIIATVVFAGPKRSIQGYPTIQKKILRTGIPYIETGDPSDGPTGTSIYAYRYRNGIYPTIYSACETPLPIGYGNYPAYSINYDIAAIS